MNTWTNTPSMVVVLSGDVAQASWSAGPPPDRVVEIESPPDYLQSPYSDFDAALAAFQKAPTTSVRLGEHEVAVVQGERFSCWKHTTNPMVYVHITGSEDDVRWLTNNGLLDDDWKDTGIRLVVKSALHVFDGSDVRRSKSVELPSGTYQLREARYWGDAGEVVLLLVIHDDSVQSLSS